MATSEKLSDPERGLNGNTEQETGFNQTDESTRFIEAGSEGDGKNANGKADSEKGAADEFYGLTREDLEKYASDPKWVKVRWILFIIFIVCWAAMLIAAIVIVVLTPKCPFVPDLTWYQSGLMYKLDVAKFQDSDNSAVGDIKGIQSQLDHFSELNVKSIWLTAGFVDADDQTKPMADLGTLEELKNLTILFKKKGIRTVMTLDGSVMDAADTDALLRVWSKVGVEGFVIENSANRTESLEFIKGWQAILDEDLNRLDDRDRTVIGDSTFSGDLDEKFAIVQNLPNPSDCTGTTACNKAKLSDISDSNTKKPWRITQTGSWNSPLTDLVLKFTMPGTPNVVYGDEIGLTGDIGSRADMDWDEVLAQKSVGYGPSHYDLFKELSTLRTTEASLRWGNMTAPNDTSEAIVFHRVAKDFAPVLVAINPSKDGIAYNVATKVYDTKDKESKDYTVGEVLVVYSISELAVGDTFDATAVYLPPSGVLVARLSEPEEDK